MPANACCRGCICEPQVAAPEQAWEVGYPQDSHRASPHILLDSADADRAKTGRPQCGRRGHDHWFWKGASQSCVHSALQRTGASESLPRQRLT